MPSRTIKFALADAAFPFLSTQQPRAVLSPDLDPAGRVPRQFWGADDSLDYNTVQVLYAENIIPVAEGWRSVRYEPALAAPSVEVPAGGFPTLGYQQYVELRGSDPIGTAAADPAPLTPLLSDTDLAPLIVQRTGLLYKLFIRFPEIYEPGYDVKWEQVSAELNASSDTTFPVVLTSPGITYAYVQGAQFLCIPGYGIIFAGASTVTTGNTRFRFLPQVCTTDDTRVILAGASNNELISNLPFKRVEISAIGASNGYMLAASGNQIAWGLFDGAKFNFSEFENNDVTGSGVRIPEDLVGTITALVGLPGGFIIFSARNAVAAFYSSSNLQMPWTFRQIPNAGGVRNSEYVTSPDESGGVYAYTSAGLQQISLNGARDMEPTANDFLMGRRQEIWDPETKLFSSFSLPESYFAKVRFLGQRYLVVSYGTASANTFLYALYFDTSLKRWGKIKAQHVDIFDYYPVGGATPATFGSLSAFTFGDLEGVPFSALTTDPEQQIVRGRQMLALLTPGGEIRSVVLDNRNSTDTVTEGVVVLGKLQISRSRWTVLHKVELEGVESDCTVNVQPSIDGRVPHRTVELMNTVSNADYQEFAGMEVGVNHGIIIEGRFDLSTVQVEVDTEGQV